jgi:hypothetical protein
MRPLAGVDPGGLTKVRAAGSLTSATQRREGMAARSASGMMASSQSESAIICEVTRGIQGMSMWQSAEIRV